MKTKIFAFALAAAAVASAFSSCQENEFGVVDLTPKDNGWKNVEAAYVYNHPCLMYTQSDFDRVKASLDNGTAPQKVKDAFANLQGARYAQTSHNPQPKAVVKRGVSGDEDYQTCMQDAAAAYQHAILWKLTGNDAYADNGIRILNAWAATCVEVTGNTNKLLLAGGQGYTFANAAEILRDYTGWAPADFDKFKVWMKDVWAPVCLDFFNGHYGNCDGHYWSNWDLVAECAYFAIGVLCEDDAMVNFVVNYWNNGVGNGCIKNLVQGTHLDPLGTGEEIAQNQESGRDQGHAEMSCVVSLHLCQMANNMFKSNPAVTGLDFFSSQDNAVMKMANYVALTNLRDGDDMFNLQGLPLVSADKIPFNTYNYCVDCACNEGKPHNHSAVQETFADDGGRFAVRPGWEIALHHYSKEAGLGAGYTYIKKMADKIRPEGGVGEVNGRYGNNSGAFDQLGWNTLMLYTE